MNNSSIAFCLLVLLFIIALGCRGHSQPLAITNVGLPAGTQGAAYSMSLSASGGTPPYVWFMIEGCLPIGLTYSSSGQITGVTKKLGTSHFVVVVIDSKGIRSKPRELSIQVDMAQRESTTPEGSKHE